MEGIIGSYASATVDGIEDVGGPAGYNNGSINDCFSTGTVTGGRWGSLTGGLVGHNDGSIATSHSMGTVRGEESVGGLVGLNRDPGSITTSYSTGPVSGDHRVGGLVAASWSGSISSSFWDVETSGRSRSDGGTGKTTAEMQTANTFLEAGWDFVSKTVNGPNDIWKISEGLDYPRLWWEKYGGGTGELNNPYLIYTAEHLNALGVEPNDYDKHFKLMMDIDLSGYSYDRALIAPGTNDANWEFDGVPFTGVFDGNGNSISNFNCTSKDKDFVGLFGYVEGENAEIKDLGLIDPNVHAGTGERVGSMVGCMHGGTINNCYAKGASVTGDGPVGGLIGSQGDGERYLGTITNCYSTGSVSGYDTVGGLVGHGGIINNCYSSCKVMGYGGVGGLVGWTGICCPGPAGTITYCYSTGSVSGIESVGGFVGRFHNGDITDCYSTSSVSGDHWVGGFLGINRGGTITNCYSVGSVLGDNGQGLVGRDVTRNGVTNCFWDIETSGQTSSSVGTGKATAEMQTATTFLEAGWDFVDETDNGTDDIWWIDEGKDYPRLWWELGDEASP